MSFQPFEAHSTKVIQLRDQVFSSPTGARLIYLLPLITGKAPGKVRQQTRSTNNNNNNSNKLASKIHTKASQQLKLNINISLFLSLSHTRQASPRESSGRWPYTGHTLAIHWPLADRTTVTGKHQTRRRRRREASRPEWQYIKGDRKGTVSSPRRKLKLSLSF